MTPDRWKRLEEIYHSVRDRDPADRAAYLAEVCADDQGLRLEIESLLVQGEILSKLESGIRSGNAQTAVTSDTTVGPYRIQYWSDEIVATQWTNSGLTGSEAT